MVAGSGERVEAFWGAEAAVRVVGGYQIVGVGAVDGCAF